MAITLSVLPQTSGRPVASFIPKVHVSLNVRDVATSVRFYEAFFGVPAHKLRPGYANFDLTEPPLKLALNEVKEGDTLTENGSLSHLGIQVSTEVEVMVVRDRLKRAGLATFDEGDTVCCWARQDKVWATDPDGHPWEVYVLLDEMDEIDDHDFSAQGIAPPSAACGCAAESTTPCCY